MPLLALPFLPLIGSFGLSFAGSFLGEKAAGASDDETKRKWGLIILAVMIVLAIAAYFIWFKK